VATLDSILAPERLVDLTQPLGPRTVLWPGSRPFTADTEVDHDTHGAYARNISLPEHAGTHLDAPVHFAREGKPVDELSLGLLVRPAVRLDVRHLVGDDPDFTLSATEIEGIERRAGAVPRGCAVLVRTGWDRFVGSPERYVGSDRPVFPGIGADAARLLVGRGVVGIGIDTLGVDPGNAGEFPAHRVTMPAGIWHLEGLVGLERVPERGAWLVAAALPIVDGSGSPARVFAVLPPD
jgi:kynurenine formamidase